MMKLNYISQIQEKENEISDIKLISENYKKQV